MEDRYSFVHDFWFSVE